MALQRLSPKFSRKIMKMTFVIQIYPRKKVSSLLSLYKLIILLEKKQNQ